MGRLCGGAAFADVGEDAKAARRYSAGLAPRATLRAAGRTADIEMGEAFADQDLPNRPNFVRLALISRRPRGNSAMATGTLKMWNADRGYGFIADDAGGPDMFLHISALQAAGIDPDNLRKGDRLSFDVESTREGKTRAGNVRRPG